MTAITSCCRKCPYDTEGMTAKCGNPCCSAEFVHLAQGKVFVLKTSRKSRISSSRVNFAGTAEGLQYAWLCDDCVARYEVTLDAEGDLKIRSRYRFRGVLPSVAGWIGLYASTWITDFGSLCTPYT